MSWDRTLDWVIVATHCHQFDVVVLLESQLPAWQLAALRKLCPDLERTPIHELRTELAGKREYRLGSYNGDVSPQVESAAKDLGLHVRIEDTSFTSYLPIDRTNELAWLIEDEHETKRIAAEMMAAGIPVEHREAD